MLIIQTYGKWIFCRDSYFKTYLVIYFQKYEEIVENESLNSFWSSAEFDYVLISSTNYKLEEIVDDGFSSDEFEGCLSKEIMIYRSGMKNIFGIILLLHL